MERRADSTHGFVNNEIHEQQYPVYSASAYDNSIDDTGLYTLQQSLDTTYYWLDHKIYTYAGVSRVEP